jgi:hypothetical protein
VEQIISPFSRQLIRICGRMREDLLFFSEVVSYNRDFLEAQSAKRTWIEAERRWLYKQITDATARLERAEFLHTQLIFQWEDQQRGRNININDMPLGSANDQA